GPYTHDVTASGLPGMSLALAPGSSDPTGQPVPTLRKEPKFAGQADGVGADPVPKPGRKFDRVARKTPIAKMAGAVTASATAAAVILRCRCRRLTRCSVALKAVPEMRACLASPSSNDLRSFMAVLQQWSESLLGSVDAAANRGRPDAEDPPGLRRIHPHP